MNAEQKIEASFRAACAKARGDLAVVRELAREMMSATDWPLLTPEEHHCIEQVALRLKAAEEREREVPERRRASVAGRERSNEEKRDAVLEAGGRSRAAGRRRSGASARSAGRKGSPRVRRAR